jgi:hypothetical protein
MDELSELQIIFATEGLSCRGGEYCHTRTVRLAHEFPSRLTALRHYLLFLGSYSDRVLVLLQFQISNLAARALPGIGVEVGRFARSSFRIIPRPLHFHRKIIRGGVVFKLGSCSVLFYSIVSLRL